ncbi:MAG: thioredoxin family protein [Muribaculaceae bacterium]
MDIKVLGPGCAKCKSTFSVIEKVIKDNGCDAQLTKIEDIEEIMSYNIMTTPAVVLNGKVVIKGKVPTESEIKQILGIN